MANTIDVKDAADQTVTVATMDSLKALVGEVQASPTANTLLDRLKTLATLLSAIDITKVAGASIATGHGTASGSVRVELPTDGTGVVAAKLQDGSGNALTSAARGSERAASVQVVDASGNQVTSFGGSNTKPNVTATFTRPANTTAYSAGDAVNDSTSAPTLMSFASFARVTGGTGYIVGARLVTDKKSITPRFRVHLFNASNPTIPNDNAAMDIRYADESKRIGYFDLPAMVTGTDTTNSTSSFAQDMTLRVPFAAAGGTQTIYALLEALDAFTPASGENFKLTLLGDVD